MSNIPEGFKPVEPASAGRSDHIPVRIGVDKKQVVSVSFNMATAEKLGLIAIARTPDSEPFVAKKLACGVSPEKKTFGLFPVALDKAGWDVSLTKGQAQRAQVQIPLPALFNMVVDPFRQESATGHFSFEHGGVVISVSEFFFGDRAPDNEPEPIFPATEPDQDHQSHQGDCNTEAEPDQLASKDSGPEFF